MLDVVVLDGGRGLATLEEEWEELYHHCPLATPFQSWAWLYSWWEFYGEPCELRLVTVCNSEELLVGIIPLMPERRRGFGRLLFVGAGPTDNLDMLVREGRGNEVSESGVRLLEQLDGWRVADLQPLRPEAAFWGIFWRWDGLQGRGWQDGCPVIDIRSWDELVASLSRNHRNTVRRALRRAEADEVRQPVTSLGKDGPGLCQCWPEAGRPAADTGLGVGQKDRLPPVWCRRQWSG